MSRIACLLLGLVLCLCPPPARAAGPRYKVSLLTMSPGWHPFERFGHSALAIEDHQSGQELAYNFGTVDDKDPDLWRRAVMAQLPYSLSTMTPGVTALRYQSREMRVQRLRLTDAQAGELQRLLTDNLRPERRRYAYDHFEDNCVTRLRDLLDQVSGGALSTALAGPAPRTFRQEVMAVLRPVPLMATAVDLVYGPYTDQPRSRYQALFLPENLAAAVKEAGLQQEERSWRGTEFEDPGTWPGSRALGLGLLLCALLGALLLRYGPPQARPRARRLLGAAGALLSLGFGAGAVALLFLSRSPFRFLQHNANLSLLSPADLLLAAPFLALLLGADGRLQRSLARAGAVVLGILLLRAALHGLLDLVRPCAQAHGAMIGWVLALRLALLGGLWASLRGSGKPTP